MRRASDARAVRLLLATHNPHKLAEFTRLLPGHELESLGAEVTLPPETGATFQANALAKARAAAEQTGLVTIADDSGIEAAALGGAPGVRSARYAGPHASDAENLAELLREAPPGSGLRYVCALALVDIGRSLERMFEGQCEGRLVAPPRGMGGFGYDPAFEPDEAPGRTMAELAPVEKDRISHRGHAARRLLAALGEL